MANDIIYFNWRAIRKLPSFSYAMAAIRILTYPHSRVSSIHKVKATTAALTKPSECFMQNSIAFLENKIRATDTERLVYLTLISRRDYLQYKLYGVTALSTCLAYGFDICKLKRNRLLNISDGNIYFKYEE